MGPNPTGSTTLGKCLGAQSVRQKAVSTYFTLNTGLNSWMEGWLGHKNYRHNSLKKTDMHNNVRVKLKKQKQKNNPVTRDLCCFISFQEDCTSCEIRHADMASLT